MQSTNHSKRILLPVRLWFIWFTLIAALGLNFVPTGRLPAVPDFVALVLAFWCIREPLHVGMGSAFLFGLLVDIGHGAAMGQHALSYVVLAYLCGTLARRMLWFPPLLQALHLLPVLLFAQALMVLARLLAGAEFPGWWYFLSSFSGAALWTPLTFLLLLPQYQPVDRDDNRPI